MDGSAINVHTTSQSLEETRDDLVDADGIIYRCDEIPNDQKKYIPIFDTWNETERLGTFGCFPKDTPPKTVKVWDLARRGVYYTGFKDRVRCCSCGTQVENWLLSVDVSSTKWHKDDCRLALGKKTPNKEVPERCVYDLIREAHRSLSELIVPLNRSESPSEELAIVKVGANRCDDLQEELFQDQTPANEETGNKPGVELGRDDASVVQDKREEGEKAEPDPNEADENEKVDATAEEIEADRSEATPTKRMKPTA